MSLMMVSVVLMMLTRPSPAASHIAEVLEEKPCITDEQADPALKVEDGSIRFDHVYFKYHDTAEAWNLEDVSFTVPSGATVGILGGTGSAKTTLVSMIPRLYDVNGGAVYVGGHNVKDYTMEALRDGCAMVLQKNTLFSGTIRENLRWGDENANRSEIEDACRLACADEFIEKMPDGYDTYIEQGGNNVSGVKRSSGCASPGRCCGEVEDTDPGRLHQRGGHRHGREDPRRAENGATRHHKAHHRPADHIRYGRRPDTGDGRVGTSPP